MAIKLFLISWLFLLVIAIVAHLILRGKPKKRAGIIYNFIVVAPYLIVFAWFGVRDKIGTYKSCCVASEILGFLIIIIGIGGYIYSILHLRHNWAVSAVIKEGQSLVKAGPYKYIRHPMYFFMMLVVLGSGLLISNYFILLYMPVIGVLYHLRAKKEEELLREAFPDYLNYIKETKMLIPGIF